MINETFDYPDYLSAKKSIDDLSLNPGVWLAMTAWVNSRQGKTKPLKILEVGAGIGTMIERLLDTGLLKDCHYMAVELEPAFQETAFNRLAIWSQSNKYSMKDITNNKRLLTSEDNRCELEWIVGDILDSSQRFEKNNYDLLIGHAVIDLLPVPVCMPDLLACLKPGGAFYFSLNFAGQTQFMPAHPHDPVISHAYHEDMDKRFPGLDWRPSQTGLDLGPWLNAQGHTLVAEGASDWNLPIESLQADTNRLFISNILDTIENALKTIPELIEWLDVRHEQLDSGELKLMVTNRDCFGTTPV